MLRCCLLLIGVFGLLFGANAAELPARDWLEGEISRLTALPNTDPETLTRYQSLLKQLESTDQKKDDIAQLRDMIKRFPQRKQALQQELEQLNQAPEPEVPPLTSAEAVEQELATIRARVEDWNSQLLSLNEQAKQLLADQGTLPAAIAEQERLLEEARQTGTTPGPDETVDQVLVWLSLARQQVHQLNLDWFKLSQETLVQRRELAQLESQVLQRRLTRAGKQVDALQDLLLQQRTESSRRLNEQARRLSRALIDAPEIIQQWNAKNEVLAQQSDELTRELLARQTERQQLEEQRQQLIQSLTQIRANIDWLKLSPAFNASIRAQLARLPELPSRSGLADRIASAHLLQFELDQEQAALKDVNVLAQQLAQQHELLSRQQSMLIGVLNFRLEVLNNLLQGNDRLITELTRLEAVRAQFVAELRQERQFLRQQQLWIRGRTALWAQFPPRAKTWLGTADLTATLNQMSQQALTHRRSLVVLALALLITLATFYKVRRLESTRRHQFAQVIGFVGRDRFRHSLWLVLLSFMSALLLPLWLIGLALWMEVAWPQNYTLDLRNLMFSLACVAFVWEASISLSKRDGILEKHLSWPAELNQWLYKSLQHQRWIIYPLLVSMVSVEAISGEQDSTLLRLLYVALVLWLVVFLARLLKSARIPSLFPVMLRGPVTIQLLRALVLLPLLAMAGLAAWGYSYAAWIMLMYHQATLAILFGALLLYQLGERWLRLEQRHLAYQRALARREEQLERRRRGEEAVVEEVDEAKLPVEEISEQSMALLNAGIIVWLFAALSAIWSEGLVAFQWMEEVTVWQVSTTTEAGVVMEAISLKAAFYAIVLLLLSVFASRNLPGLLELLVLRRLNISTGAAYATTTLLRYSLILIGTIIAFSTMGFHWSKLQWLVAALGVGLGFGLQEIFANLVSGIILLFERPIRVGDTITINNLSGTVTRINTRATTIVDWDNKEIVVPNKSLITDQLVNWSLTDAVTRLVIKVGVAYGSDIVLVKQLLRQIADEHPDVLADPEPSVVFLAFGASSLDFELRVFLPRLDLRIPTLDAVNSSIDQLFNAHGVKIAYPKMDIHVQDLPQQETADLKTSEKGSA